MRVGGKACGVVGPSGPCCAAQVRSDCPPGLLLEFLAGEAGLAANEAAETVASSRAEEEALLQQVRARAWRLQGHAYYFGRRLMPFI